MQIRLHVDSFNPYAYFDQENLLIILKLRKTKNRRKNKNFCFLTKLGQVVTERKRRKMINRFLFIKKEDKFCLKIFMILVILKIRPKIKSYYLFYTYKLLMLNSSQYG